MRDCKVLTIENFGLDIDFIDGQPSMLDYADQTGDQRASLCVYAVKGTVPGASDYGVSWADQYSEDNTVTQLNNEIQQQLQTYAGATDNNPVTVNTTYQGTLLSKNGKLAVVITRG